MMEWYVEVSKYGDENKLIPVISGGGLYPYDFNGYAKYDLGTPVKARFANALHHSDGLSVTGWILYILMNSLVLLNYLVTQRSYVVGPRRSKNGKSGGLEL